MAWITLTWIVGAIRLWVQLVCRDFWPWALRDFRLTGDVVFYRRVQGKETADGVADRGTQAQGSGCPG
jgi:hypothetical protein